MFCRGDSLMKPNGRHHTHAILTRQACWGQHWVRRFGAVKSPKGIEQAGQEMLSLIVVHVEGGAGSHLRSNIRGTVLRVQSCIFHRKYSTVRRKVIFKLQSYISNGKLYSVFNISFKLQYITFNKCKKLVDGA